MNSLTDREVIVWNFSRASREWVGPLTVTARDDDDVPQPVTGWQVTLCKLGVNPTSDAVWTDPTGVDNRTGLGVLVGPGTARILTPGSWVPWVRYTGTSELPVFPADARLDVT